MARKTQQTLRPVSSIHLFMAAIAAHELAQKGIADWGNAKAFAARFYLWRVADGEVLNTAIQKAIEAAETKGRNVIEDPELGKPPGFRNWSESAESLWKLAGVSTNYEKLATGQRIQVSPYHLKIATDPKHPLYDRRVKKPVPVDLINSIRELKYVKDSIHVAVWPEEDELALYTVDGRQRLRAALHVNQQYLLEFIEVAFEMGLVEADSHHLPPIICSLSADLHVDEQRSKTVNAIGNMCRLDEDSLGLSAKCASLMAMYNSNVSTVAALMGLSVSTVTNLLRLQTLAPRLKEYLEAGQLNLATAYILGEHPHKKQLAAWSAAIQNFSKPADRQRAVVHYLATGEALKPAASGKVPKPLATNRIRVAVDRLAKLDDAELQPFQQLLAAVAGDEAAFESLPQKVRDALSPPERVGPTDKPWVDAGFEVKAVKGWRSAGFSSATKARELADAGVLPHEAKMTVKLDGVLCKLGGWFEMGRLNVEQVKARIKVQRDEEDAARSKNRRNAELFADESTSNPPDPFPLQAGAA